jgi:hydroxylamine dehydrogenase
VMNPRNLSFLIAAPLVAAATLALGCSQSLHAEQKSDPAASVQVAGANSCVECHGKSNPGIVDHYRNSKHADLGVECIDCHNADPSDLDAWEHEGEWIATIVTPRDCGQCHDAETEEFEASHHAKGGNILHSLDNLLAEVVEGHRGPVTIPHPHKPGESLEVNGLAFANSGCHQCHGSQVALETKDGGSMTPWTLKLPEGGGMAAVTHDLGLVDRDQIARGENGQPLFDSKTWPNTGIGRLNLDGSRGSCTACHSRHDFSSRRARQPENCGKCHLGPDHPQKEIYEESKHGIAYRDLKDDMNLDADTWVLGEDYSAAPTCATCHMSATRDLPVTHDPRERISWNNRPPASVRIEDEEASWEERRATMQQVCVNCHSSNYVEGFFKQYDDFVELYNAKYANPGLKIMAAMKDNGLLSKPNFDETVEWTWFYIWHHEGRRARHGASMMAPDYAHWHGTFEVADRWYNEFVPELRHIIEEAKHDPAKKAGAEKVEALLDEVLAAPEHQYATTGVLPKK